MGGVQRIIFNSSGGRIDDVFSISGIEPYPVYEDSLGRNYMKIGYK